MKKHLTNKLSLMHGHRRSVPRISERSETRISNSAITNPTFLTVELPVFGKTQSSSASALPANFLNPAISPSTWAAHHLGDKLQLDPLQNQILDCPSSRIALLCSRQWGKSTVIAIKLLHYALHNPNTNIVIAANAESQSAGLLEKAKSFARHLQLPAIHRKESLTLANGSQVKAIPNSPSTVRGLSGIHILIIDEAAFVPDNLFHTIVPFLATTNGHLWLLSTANGQKGFFYDIITSKGAHASTSLFSVFLATAADCPRITPEFLADERSLKPDSQFEREYNCKFLATRGQIFDAAILRTTSSTTQGPLAPTLLFGLDIGFQQSHTALAVLHLSWSHHGQDPFTHAPKYDAHLSLVELNRFPLATAHQEAWATIDRVIQRHTELVTKNSATPNRVLIFDYAGAGQVYFEHFKKHCKGTQIQPVTITGGQTPQAKSDYVTIPRQDLLNTLKVLLETNALQIPPGLNYLKELMDELKGINLTNTHRTHDDLAIALSLAAYRARIQMANPPNGQKQGTHRMRQKRTLMLVTAQSHSKRPISCDLQNKPRYKFTHSTRCEREASAFRQAIVYAVRAPHTTRPAHHRVIAIDRFITSGIVCII